MNNGYAQTAAASSTVYSYGSSASEVAAMKAAAAKQLYEEGKLAEKAQEKASNAYSMLGAIGSSLVQ